MNKVDELKLLVTALSSAIESDPKFFVSIVHYVQRLSEITSGLSSETTQDELALLNRKIQEFYKKWRPSGNSLYIPPRQTSDTDTTVLEIHQLIVDICEMSKEDFARLLPKSITAKIDNKEEQQPSPCVFIGHGRSQLWARLKIYLEDELNLPTVTYESESRTGESIVPVLEKMLDQASFAVLVLTAEDETNNGTIRARQNVIHEAGLFQGRLGFKKAILLLQQGIEEFTNVAGIQYIPFSDSNIEQSFYELQRVLKREKQIT
jgi:predicted nucleotide-binding protein